MHTQIMRGIVVVGMSMGILAFASPAPTHPAAAKRLLLDELKTFKTLRRVMNIDKSTIDLSAFAGDPDFAKAIAALGTDAKKATVDAIEAAAGKLDKMGDEKSLALLAMALKFVARSDARPGAKPGELEHLLLMDSLDNFAEDDAPLALPAPLKEKILAALQAEDRGLGRPVRDAVTGSALRSFFTGAASKSLALTPHEMLHAASAANFAAALELGDSYLRRAAKQREESFGSGGFPLFRKREEAPKKPVLEISPEPHMKQAERERPDVTRGAGCTGAALPMPPVNAIEGRVRLTKPEQSGLKADPVQFSADEEKALNKAVGHRKSLAMEVGQELFNRATGQTFFNARSLCQATVVTPAGESALHFLDAAGQFCRYVVASAKHCFRGLKEQDEISLAGFTKPIDASHRHVIVSGGQGEDFAVMLVDAPCDASIPTEPLAPPDYVNLRGGQAMVMDVQQTGEHAVAGRTAASKDGAFLGVSVVGQGRIFPGDSGGRFSLVDASGQTYFAGVTSSKLVSPVFRDGVGNVALVPDWMRNGFNSGVFYRELPQDGLVMHLAQPERNVAPSNFAHGS